MSPHPCSIEVAGLDLNRGGRLVLQGVSVRFPPGAVTALVGPSGSGKTSLLRCINRLEEPQRGEVRVDGVDIREIAPTELRRRVGMIFQTPVLFDGGVRANLDYGLAHVDEATLVDALEGASLSPSFLERESSALSVGQAQRVCIARALMRAPDALLLDEPTSALDKDASARIESLAASLVARGLTLVWVTHDLAQARRVASNAVLIADGQVVASGTTDEIEDAWPEEVG